MLHNVMYSPTLQSSPFRCRYGSPPPLTRLIGDTVVPRPPREKTGPKTLAFPGRSFLFLGELNPTTTLVYDSTSDSPTVYRIHPSQVLSSIPRSAAGLTEPPAQSLTPPPPHFPPKAPPTRPSPAAVGPVRAEAPTDRVLSSWVQFLKFVLCFVRPRVRPWRRCLGRSDASRFRRLRGSSNRSRPGAVSSASALEAS
eukprot:GHVU01143092.1.p1 GENE.GHVU01143092.1~~GHVU01143092.1.p1  ORF type:complete len:197 (+),score=6.06 GHVU01143092.1:201-791(+)